MIGTTVVELNSMMLPHVSMANAGLKCQPGKGNRRTGVCRGTPSGRRRGTLPWRKDLVILRRMAVVVRGAVVSGPLIAGLPLVNQWLIQQGIDPISRRTFYMDLKRVSTVIVESG